MVYFVTKYNSAAPNVKEILLKNLYLIQNQPELNDQFTPNGLEAHIGASGSRYQAVHVCWYPFYRPRKDRKLSEL